MQTFIVRFYREGVAPLGEIAGTVEHVDSGERTGFANQRELLERLLHGDALTDEQSRSCDAAELPAPSMRGAP